MTIPTGWAPIGDPTVRAAQQATATATKAKAGDELGKDAFLKLMVAQLRYQDPTSPVQGAEFLAQTAQFSSVEMLQQISAATADTLASQQRLAAATMVGSTVTYLGADGMPTSGVVDAAVFGGPDGTMLRIGSTDVPLAGVSEVRAAVASSPPAPST